MRDLLQDLRYGVRTLVKNTGFTSIAILTLALGIGAVSAIFSFVDGVLLRPLPYPDADRIVLVWEKPPNGDRNVISALNFLDWRASATSFEALSANSGVSMTLTGGARPVLLNGARSSAGYFEIYRVRPELGRTFAPDEDQPGRDHVVVLSHRLWATRFGGDPSLVGRSILLDGEPYTVIGVMPAASLFDRGWSQFWRPLAFRPGERTRNFHWLQVFGRLKPGVSLDQARAEMNAIGARIARDYPDSNKGWGVTVDRYEDVLVNAGMRQSLYVLLGAVGMLLLIGCANLANLTLARGTAREREVAVRAALGAARGRLVRQFLAENVLLALCGGALGVLLGYAVMVALRQMLPPLTFPRDVEVAMDARVLVFALLLSILTGILFGLAPALHATRPDLTAPMKEGGRSATPDIGRRLRQTLVVGQVALAFALLVGAGLLIRSFFEMMRIDLGVDETNVLTMNLPIASDRFSDSARLTDYVRQIVARVDAIPGVREAAAADSVPLRGWNNGMPFLIAGRAVVDRSNRQSAGFKMASASYFHTLGMKLVKGRRFSDRDTRGAPPVMIINQTLAARYFTTEDPIGQRILVQQIVPGQPQLGPEIPWQVVGIVADERTSSLDRTQTPGMYVPIEQSPTTYVNLVVRGATDPAALQRAIADAVAAIDKDQSISDVLTLTAIKDEVVAPNRLRTMLLSVFAGFALLLSAIGVYGVMSYSVAQRTHELGIRAALGADRTALLRMVLAHGLALAVAGLAIGAVASLALSRLLASLLFGVTPRDPLTMTISAGILGLVALCACYVPARRAARLDPLAALRFE